MKYPISIYRLTCVIGMMINLQIQNIAAQGDALTLTHNCETGCIDLQINGGFSPYDVEWQRLVGGQWTSLTGWPKSALNGNDGVEDLCSDTNMSEPTQFKVMVQDALCGTAEATITIEPCNPCDGLESITYDLSFPNSGVEGKVKNLTVNFGFPENLGGYSAPILVELYDLNGNLLSSDTYISYDDDPILGGGGVYFENLTLGDEYCLKFIDVIGCNFTKCFTVQGESCIGQWRFNDIQISPKKCANTLGSISFSIEAADPGCLYTTAWSNGQNNATTIANLEAGNYCISITGMEGCEDCLTVLCFDVEDESSKYLINVTPKITYYCTQINENGTIKFQWFGRLFLDFQNFNSEFEINWDKLPYTSNGNHFIFDKPGTYCATISNQCYTKVICIDLTETEQIANQIPVNECLKFPNDSASNLDSNTFYSRAQITELSQLIQDISDKNFPAVLQSQFSSFMMKILSIQDDMVQYEIFDSKLNLHVASVNFKYKEDGDILFRTIEGLDFLILPNPIHDSANLLITYQGNPKEGKVFICNQMGEILQEKNLNIQTGTNIVPIDEIHDYPSGMYFVKILFYDGTGTYLVRKIIKT